MTAFFDEIFQRVVAAADEEITAGSRDLFFSGLAAGFAIPITFLLYISLTASTGGHPVLSAMLYPLGLIHIIVGGYRLYTENTLPPVALTLERIASVPALLCNWLVVLAGNFTGGTFGAIALAWGGVLSADGADAAAKIASKGIETGSSVLFAKAAFAGLIVAGVVRVGYASRTPSRGSSSSISPSWRFRSGGCSTSSSPTPRWCISASGTNSRSG